MSITKKQYRRCGHYWVCPIGSTPTIAFCWGLVWTISGDEKAYRERDFEYIMPEPLPAPSFATMRLHPVKKEETQP